MRPWVSVWDVMSRLGGRARQTSGIGVFTKGRAREKRDVHADDTMGVVPEQIRSIRR